MLVDEKNNNMGYSRKAAVVGIASVVFSRVSMAFPGMSNYNRTEQNKNAPFINYDIIILLFLFSFDSGPYR